jgi:hypothetical protein
MRLLWLPEVLRAAGLTVHEYAGWRTRGSDDWGPIRGITCHATAGSRTSTDAGELRVIVNGSATAPPPISQLYLSRSGEWWVVASGRCNHNLTGWDGPNKGYGNSRLLGIEAQHSNTSAEPWPDRQYRSYVRGVAALVEKLGVPVSRVAGHKEHQPYATRPSGATSTKSDPTFNMDQFRRDVAAVLAGEDDDMTDDDRKKLNAIYAAMFTGGPSCGFEVDPGNGRGKANSIVNKADELLKRSASAPVESGQVDVTALATALKPHLKAAAVEAVRQVLGEVDGATPAGG